MAVGVYASPFFNDKGLIKASIVKHNDKTSLERLKRLEKKAGLTTPNTSELPDKKIIAPPKKPSKNPERKTHGFVADNRTKLDTEITSLQYALNINPDNEEDWLYLYYCLSLMEKYYDERGKPLDEDSPYIKSKKKVKLHLNLPVDEEKDKIDGFIANLQLLIQKKYNKLAKTDKFGFVKDKAMDANLLRLGWVFLRLTLKQGLLLGDELKLLEKIGRFLGKDINVQDLIDYMEKPNPTLAKASVGLFGIRFVYNIMSITQRVWTPAKNEKKDIFGRLNILWREISEKHPELLNDFVWIVVNGIANFPQYSHVAPMVGLYLTAAFLYFDLSLLTWRYYLDYLKYKDKKQQFIYEKDTLIKQAGDNQKAIDTLDLQIESLEIEWCGKKAFWKYNMIGSFLLAAGFSATLMIANPILLPLCFAVCLVGISMYMTAGTYRTMKQKKAELKETKPDSRFFSMRQKEYDLATQNHHISLAKHLIMPSLIIGTFLICWQASIALMALFLVVELGTRYLAKSKENTIETEKAGLSLSF